MNSRQHSAQHLLLPLCLVGVNTSVWQRGNRSSGELEGLAPGCQLSQDANPGLGGASGGAGAFPPPASQHPASA